MASISQTIRERQTKMRWFVGYVIAGLSLCYGVPAMSAYPYEYSAGPEAKDYPKLKYTLMELIEALPKPMPTTLDTIQNIFNHQYRVKNQNEAFTFYKAGPFITKDGVVIAGSEASIKNTQPNIVRSVGFAFDQKQCVDAKLLKKKFGFYVPVFYPNPEYPDLTQTSYDIFSDWGGFSILTYDAKPNCALGIGVGVYIDEQDKQKWLQYRKQFEKDKPK